MPDGSWAGVTMPAPLTAVARLRPAKLRSGARRRWFQWRLERTPLDDAPGLIDLGTPYGGWTIPATLIEPSWTCYCVGIGADPSFDLELIQRYGVSVRAFDAVAEYVELATSRTLAEPRFSARVAAIATSDGPLRMQVTHDARSQSVSSARLYDSVRFVEMPGRTIESLMAELNDSRVDLLKLDIEGGEYDVIPGLDLARIGVKVFASQLHHSGSVRQAQSLISLLRDRGYVPVACRPSVKMTFARADLL